MSVALQLLIIALVFVFAGLLAHFVADNLDRSLWEAWGLVTGVSVLSVAAVMIGTIATAATETTAPFKVGVSISIFSFVGIAAHYAAMFRGRPWYEPAILTFVAFLMATLGSVFVLDVFMLLALFPPLAVFGLPRRKRVGELLTSACPHCRNEFIVDFRFAGKPVTCPHCKQLFLGPSIRRTKVG